MGDGGAPTSAIVLTCHQCCTEQQGSQPGAPRHNQPRLKGQSPPPLQSASTSSASAALDGGPAIEGPEAAACGTAAAMLRRHCELLMAATDSSVVLPNRRHAEHYRPSRC